VWGEGDGAGARREGRGDGEESAEDDPADKGYKVGEGQIVDALRRDEKRKCEKFSP
jgi:hypothetical protein